MALRRALSLKVTGDEVDSQYLAIYRNQAAALVFPIFMKESRVEFTAKNNLLKPVRI